MSQNADGGLITTKPYFSGSSYVKKMSNFKSGEWCQTWDGLYGGGSLIIAISSPKIEMVNDVLYGNENER